MVLLIYKWCLKKAYVCARAHLLLAQDSKNIVYWHLLYVKPWFIFQPSVWESLRVRTDFYKVACLQVDCPSRNKAMVSRYYYWFRGQYAWLLKARMRLCLLCRLQCISINVWRSHLSSLRTGWWNWIWQSLKAFHQVLVYKISIMCKEKSTAYIS